MATTPALAPAATRSDWQQVMTLLDTALELDAAARAGWLRALAPEHARLMPLLDELLRPPAGSDHEFMRVSALDVIAEAGPINPPSATGEIGPYRLLRQIGEGGMASVWLAVRSDGLLDRQVALKLPHLAWGTAAFADRMARERQILASLTHPHIARLYDAGMTSDGRPWLALEYVDGQPIDAYAAAHRLATRARVGLVVEVARAVAHAHARLVVHRDLKPSNILVDSAGHAHLLDFGIAKLVDPSFGDGDSVLTQAPGRALTPDYASPEQIRGDAIGTASDVYSLGVVLFELLAGERPYRLKRAHDAGALARAIAEIEPPRPSAVAADPAVARQLRGDLDAIVARAMAKASGERYPTIDAFAADLERYLRGEPVQARPDAWWYRGERWMRRHKLQTAIALAVVVALLGGNYAQLLVASALGSGAALALWQRNRASAEAARARAALARAEQVKAFIASIFTQAVPNDGRGGPVTAVGLLQAAARRIETDLAGQPEVAAELGALIGASLNELGEMKAALAWLPRAVELCTRSLGATHPLTMQARRRLVEAANTLGDLAVSEPLLAPLVLDARANETAAPALLVEALRSLAFVHTKRGREEEAMAALHEAVALAARHLGEDSEVALETRSALSNTCKHFGRFGEALREIEPALAPARRRFDERRPNKALIAVERGYADALARNQRPRDAVALLHRVLADQRALDVGETTRVRIAMTMLGQALIQGGHFAEAERVLSEAELMHERLCPGVTDEGITLPVARALACAMGGQGAAALAHCDRADGWAAGRGETRLLADGRVNARLLALAGAGRSAEALAEAGRLLTREPAPSPSSRLQAHVVQAGLLRSADAAAAARAAADRGLAALAEPGCAALHVGRMWAESARCHLAAGATAAAHDQFELALAAWGDGQVDGPALVEPVQAELEALRPFVAT